jgi:hypothetical protein
MAIAPASEKYFWLSPVTKRDADVLAFKLFCLFSFVLVGLIVAGVL